MTIANYYGRSLIQKDAALFARYLEQNAYQGEIDKIFKIGKAIKKQNERNADIVALNEQTKSRILADELAKRFTLYTTQINAIPEKNIPLLENQNINDDDTFHSPKNSTTFMLKDNSTNMSPKIISNKQQQVGVRTKDADTVTDAGTSVGTTMDYKFESADWEGYNPQHMQPHRGYMYAKNYGKNRYVIPDAKSANTNPNAESWVPQSYLNKIAFDVPHIDKPLPTSVSPKISPVDKAKSRRRRNVTAPQLEEVQVNKAHPNTGFVSSASDFLSKAIEQWKPFTATSPQSPNLQSTVDTVYSSSRPTLDQTLEAATNPAFSVQYRKSNRKASPASSYSSVSSPGSDVTENDPRYARGSNIPHNQLNKVNGYLREYKLSLDSLSPVPKERIMNLVQDTINEKGDNARLPKSKILQIANQRELDKGRIKNNTRSRAKGKGLSKKNIQKQKKMVAFGEIAAGNNNPKLRHM